MLVDHSGKVEQEKEFRLSVQSLLKQNFLVHRNSYVRTSVFVQSNGRPSYPFSIDFESLPKKNDQIITTESRKNTMHYHDVGVASKLFEILDCDLETLNNKGFSKITGFLIKGILGEILIP